MSETKKTYEELLAEIDELKKKCDELTEENKGLKITIDNLRDGYEVSSFFFDCRSLQSTADKFFYDNIVDCANDLIYFNNEKDSIRCAKDYREYCILSGNDDDEDIYDGEDNLII